MPARKKAARRRREPEPSDLRPDPENPNLGTKRGLDLLETSFEQFGAMRSAVAASDGIVLAGNKSFDVAREKGFRIQEIPVDGRTFVVLRRTDMASDDPRARAYKVADNRIGQVSLEWDPEVMERMMADGVALGDFFFPEELADLGVLEAPPPRGTGDDDLPVAVEPTTEPGDVWILGPHRLLCGSASEPADVVRLMDGERADCVFTSPPYAVGVDYGPTYEDTLASLRPLLASVATMWRDLVLVDGGFAVVNFGDIVSGREAANSETPCEYPMALEYWPVFRAAGYSLWSRRVWCKPVARVAAPWCASSNRSATNFEHVWTWKLPGEAIVGRVPGPMDSQTGWFDTSRLEGVDVGKETHGAGMPVSTAEWMLRVHSRDHSIVHEPFTGTGTTMIAAEKLGRRCFGTEISPIYCDIAVRRWEAYTQRTAERVRP